MFALAISLVAASSALDLLDDPIQGTSYFPLDSFNADDWTVSYNDKRVNASVPGDLLTDLERAQVIGDPLYGMNFQDKTWDQEWVYTRMFDYNKSATDLEVYLVFDSIKMAASVYLNGNHLGDAIDQFLRYEYPIGKLLSADGKNNLTVAFATSVDTRNNQTRWMGCSGAWDWAPYGTTFNADGTHTFSKGIVRSVYLVGTSSTTITHVVPHLQYLGPYPSTPLKKSDNQTNFNVTVTVHFNSPSKVSGELRVFGMWDASKIQSAKVDLPAGESKAQVTLTAERPALWWPLGLGDQVTFEVVSTFFPNQDSSNITHQPIKTSRAIGFRVVHLVTADDSKPASLSGVDGSGDLTMRIKVNGASIYARGANVIPMEEMEGRQNAAAYVQMMSSAAAAHFNMIRIWGGGTFLPKVFYDTCDELGIIIFHDMMYGEPWFGGTGGTPKKTPTQIAEIQHNVRALSAHPSIIAWNGGNEWQHDLSIFDEFVMTTVVSEDASRPVWPISPSKGWASGVDRLTGLPNGKNLSHQDKGTDIETHGPYQHGSGFLTRNGHGDLEPFDANLPPKLQPTSTVFGANERGHFASEFGCSVFSSFESMAPTLNRSDWAPHAAPWFERNYPCDSIIDMFFGPLDLNTTVGSAALLKKVTYLCMMGQTFNMKSNIEARRSSNELGTLTWQLNEIWPTGGWGSLEYGTVGFTEGQVLGGRWKPLHHMMESHLYKDQIVICGNDGRCLIKNDDPLKKASFTWNRYLLNLETGKRHHLGGTDVTIAAGPGATAWHCLDGSVVGNTTCNTTAQFLHKEKCKADGSNCIFISEAVDDKQVLLDENMVLFTVPGNLTIKKTKVTAVVSIAPDHDGMYSIELMSDGGTALMVTLTSQAQGRFSGNMVTIPDGHTRTIRFLHFGEGPADRDLLEKTLRVEHLGLYL